MNSKKLWIGFILVMVISFGILGYFGREIYRQAPPIPEKVITPDGSVLFTSTDIKDGQNVWQSMGGQEVGTIWGHGAYKAPDWTADWLHKEALFILDTWSLVEFSQSYADLEDEKQALLQKRLQNELRKNTYDVASKSLVISKVRAEAIKSNSAHYSGLFMSNPIALMLCFDTIIKMAFL